MIDPETETSRPVLYATVFFAVIVAWTGFEVFAGDVVRTNFNSQGLQSVTFGDLNLVKDNRPRVLMATRDSGEAEWLPGSYLPKSTYDEGSRRLEQTWSLGKLVTVYRPEGDKLGLSLTFTNTTGRPLHSIHLRAMQFVFPETPYGPGWHQSNGCSSEGVDDIAAVIAKFGRGTLVAVAETLRPELRLAFTTTFDKVHEIDMEHRIYNLNLSTLTRSAKDLIHVDQPVLGPGESVRFEISLRFGTEQAGLEELTGDVTAKFREQFPPVLKWNDRRPIAMLMLASAAPQHHSVTNPRGWLNNPKLDVTTPGGRESFKRNVLSWADLSVSLCKSYGAQGGIVWDVEGQEFPPLVFVGDPRKVPDLAPEFDAIADAFFKKFTDASLKTGVCIRPSRLERHPSSNPIPPWKHEHMAFDPVEEMADKITYAKKRWGCTLFYIDTNVTLAFTGEKDKNGKDQIANWFIRADSMRRLAALHPDVLLIPEFQYTGYYSHVSGYRELRGGQASTPQHVLKTYPDAFSVINVNDGKLKERRDDLLAAVKRGDILMYRGWFNSSEAATVRYLYQEASRKK